MATIKFSATSITNPLTGEIVNSVFDIAALCNVENVGWDDRYHADILLSTVRGENDRVEWHTATSNFRYVITGNRNDGWNIVYDGAIRGFLAQALLPGFEGVRIHSVKSAWVGGTSHGWSMDLFAFEQHLMPLIAKKMEIRDETGEIEPVSWQKISADRSWIDGISEDVVKAYYPDGPIWMERHSNVCASWDTLVAYGWRAKVGEGNSWEENEETFAERYDVSEISERGISEEELEEAMEQLLPNPERIRYEDSWDEAQQVYYDLTGTSLTGWYPAVRVKRRNRR